MAVAVGRPSLAGDPVEVLCGAANLALANQLDQVGFGQLGDVVVGVAEGDLQLVAEVAGGESPATVEPRISRIETRSGCAVARARCSQSTGRDPFPFST